MHTLYGTITSPFVRRVRVVCLEKGLPFTLVDTSTEDGQRQLKQVSPIGKVPVCKFPDGRTVYDSRVILDELCSEANGGWAPLRAPARDIRSRVEEENAVNVVDEALLSLIRLFYLKRDGADLSLAYLQKEQARAQTILQHLNDHMYGDHVTMMGQKETTFGRPELALFTALGWMRFRQTFDLSTTPQLLAFFHKWEKRESLQQTEPK